MDWKLPATGCKKLGKLMIFSTDAKISFQNMGDQNKGGHGSNPAQIAPEWILKYGTIISINRWKSYRIKKCVKAEKTNGMTQVKMLFKKGLLANMVLH